MYLPQTLLLCGLALAAPVFQAQQPDFSRGSEPAVPAAPDPAIARALATIQAARIQETIDTLVRFGTRNTLSSPTTAPDWQYELTSGPGMPGADVSLTVPVSKDNVVFGVRAVDEACHRGLVVVP